MADIKFDYAADVTAAERAIARLEQKVEKLENKNKQLHRTSRRGAQESTSDFQRMTQNVTAFAGALGLVTSASAVVQGAIRLIRREFEDMVATQKKAADATRTFAQAFDAALINLGVGPEATPENLQGMIDRIVQRTGAGQRDVANALANALSARGNLSLQQVEQAVAGTLVLTKNLQQAQAPLSGAVLDIMKQVAGVTTEQALGFLLSTGTQARVVDPKFLAENITPAVLAVQATGGDTPRQGAALISALTQAMSDVTGAISGTAAIQLDAALEKFLPEAAGLEQRIATLRGDEALRRRFFDQFTFRARAQKPIEQLLTPGSEIAKQFDDAAKAIVPIFDAARVFSEKQQQFAETQFRATLDLIDGLKAVEEQLRLANQPGAQISAVREGLEGILESAGVGPTSRDFFRAEFELAAARGGAEAGLQELVDFAETRAAGLRRGRAPAVGPFGVVGVPTPPSPAELEQAEKLDRIGDGLDALLEELKKGNQQNARGSVNRAAQVE